MLAAQTRVLMKEVTKSSLFLDIFWRWSQENFLKNWMQSVWGKEKSRMTHDLGAEQTGKMKLLLIKMVKQVDRVDWERGWDSADLLSLKCPLDVQIKITMSAVGYSGRKSSRLEREIWEFQPTFSGERAEDRIKKKNRRKCLDRSFTIQRQSSSFFFFFPKFGGH